MASAARSDRIEPHIPGTGVDLKLTSIYTCTTRLMAINTTYAAGKYILKANITETTNEA